MNPFQNPSFQTREAARLRFDRHANSPWVAVPIMQCIKVFYIFQLPVPGFKLGHVPVPTNPCRVYLRSTAWTKVVRALLDPARSASCTRRQARSISPLVTASRIMRS